MRRIGPKLLLLLLLGAPVSATAIFDVAQGAEAAEPSRASGLVELDARARLLLAAVGFAVDVRAAP